MAAVETAAAFSCTHGHSLIIAWLTLLVQVIDLTRQQEITKQQEAKQKEAEFKAQAAQFGKVMHGG